MAEAAEKVDERRDRPSPERAERLTDADLTFLSFTRRPDPADAEPAPTPADAAR